MVTTYTEYYREPGQSPQATLTKAIERAIEGGWRHEITPTQPLMTSAEYWSKQDYRLFAYRHDFARALWGEEPTRKLAFIDAAKYPEYICPNWQYHLSQMVISPDPIKYLEEHI